MMKSPSSRKTRSWIAGWRNVLSTTRIRCPRIGFGGHSASSRPPLSESLAKDADHYRAVEYGTAFGEYTQQKHSVFVYANPCGSFVCPDRGCLFITGAYIMI